MKSRKLEITVASGENAREGITIAHHTKEGLIEVSGWYDSCVGIPEHTFTVEEFKKRLGLV